ncbi:MAG: hypothetical protein ACD_4C00099G0004 [uncultured bacterium (gcode 4)]|uniref:Uncharacterized protein n=1 Tax=uncultured bacterium (gcode 4) TaxID=1234023 RepID=K2FVI7_9BACT|nr:MAG: hypothetical protein ACD_4C00099G0004 [uncultured bacterium (gcode 4)]
MTKLNSLKIPSSSSNIALELLKDSFKQEQEMKFPVEFANTVAQILEEEQEYIRTRIYNSENVHSIFPKLKLPFWVDFTFEELDKISRRIHKFNEYGIVFNVINIVWLPDWIYFDLKKWTSTTQKVIIVKNPKLYEGNNYLKSAEISIEYTHIWKDDITWSPGFSKTLYYLDYRNS